MCDGQGKVRNKIGKKTRERENGCCDKGRERENGEDERMDAVIKEERERMERVKEWML